MNITELTNTLTTMQQTHLTPSELERLAYISGNTVRANILAQIDDTTGRLDHIENSLIDSDVDIDAMLEASSLDIQIDGVVHDRCPNYAEYKAFFDECFQRLAGHYPCPEVTSDYDKSIIFATIERGEAAGAEGGE